MSKQPREFWVWINSSEIHKSTVFDKEPDFSKIHESGYRTIVCHVREVSPAYDEAVKELADTLQSIINDCDIERDAGTADVAIKALKAYKAATRSEE